MTESCRSINVVCGTLVYYDQDAGSYAPIASGYIHGDYVDMQYGTHTGGWATYTEADGYYEIPCSAGPATYFQATLDADNSGVVTLAPASMGTYSPYAGDQCDWDDGNIIVDNSEMARVYTNLNVTISQSRSFFGYTRNGISVVFFNGTSTDVSYYYWGDDRIHINRTPSAQQVWGPFGVFTAAHEYGHALQQQALGGIPPHSCPSTHQFNVAMDWSCAYTEGWADYHAAATRGSAGSFFSAIESDQALLGNSNGAGVEGSVAAFLFDLSDPANESPHDVMQYPGHYVAEIVKTCKTATGFGTQQANTVAGLILCFEDTFDLTTWNTYFSAGGGTTPYGESNTAAKPSGWSATDIRTAWKWNLFAQ